MKKLHATVIAVAVGGALTGSAVYAFADNAGSGSQPFEGIVVEDVVAVEQLPSEVQQGSIKVGEANEQAMAGMARLGALDAINIATKAAPGKLTELQLDEESGYLIWEVTELGQDGQEVQLKLDAGNGRLLAAEVGDHQEDRGDKDHEDRGEGKHSSWKFWEDNDRDERGGDRD
jgi:hypothetical protein